MESNSNIIHKEIGITRKKNNSGNENGKIIYLILRDKIKLIPHGRKLPLPWLIHGIRWQAKNAKQSTQTISSQQNPQTSWYIFLLINTIWRVTTKRYRNCIDHVVCVNVIRAPNKHLGLLNQSNHPLDACATIPPTVERRACLANWWLKCPQTWKYVCVVVCHDILSLWWTGDMSYCSVSDRPQEFSLNG